MNNLFDKNYFENGLQTGKSTYENYRWIPELTIPLAYEIIRYLDIQRCHEILDFGSAKGYLVKAFRLLHFNAYGIDISRYAIDHAPDDISRHLRFWNGKQRLYEYLRSMYLPFDWIIAKDVFEHIHENCLHDIVNDLSKIAINMFVIVPLGKNGTYNASLNNLDPTHVICEDYEWWKKYFEIHGWKVLKGTTSTNHMKQMYSSIENAHGFYTLKQK